MPVPARLWRAQGPGPEEPGELGCRLHDAVHPLLEVRLATRGHRPRDGHGHRSIPGRRRRLAVWRARRPHRPMLLSVTLSYSQLVVAGRQGLAPTFVDSVG